MRVWLTIGVVFVAVVGLVVSQIKSAPSKAQYSLSTIEISDESHEREQGLSGRTTLPDDYGMLFIFPRAELHGFWMKDMRIPIDIIWLASDHTIVGITHNVSPDSYPAVIYPPSPVPYVLEVRSGLAHERGWATSTLLSLPLDN
jgi:uncharacterized protein